MPQGQGSPHAGERAQAASVLRLGKKACLYRKQEENIPVSEYPYREQQWSSFRVYTGETRLRRQTAGSQPELFRFFGGEARGAIFIGFRVRGLFACADTVFRAAAYGRQVPYRHAEAGGMRNALPVRQQRSGHTRCIPTRKRRRACQK